MVAALWPCLIQVSRLEMNLSRVWLWKNLSLLEIHVFFSQSLHHHTYLCVWSCLIQVIGLEMNLSWVYLWEKMSFLQTPVFKLVTAPLPMSLWVFVAVVFVLKTGWLWVLPVRCCLVFLGWLVFLLLSSVCVCLCLHWENRLPHVGCWMFWSAPSSWWLRYF